MYELVWFVAGAAATLAAVRLVRRARGPVPTAATAAPERAVEAVPEEVRLSLPTAASEARRVALTLAEELATLVSGIEGRAHQLVEAAPDRTQLPAAAESFLLALQRLRTLHKKLVAFGKARTAAPGSTEVATIVAGLTDDLQQMQLGIEVSWEPPPGLPRIAADPDIVRDALLFLCAALLRAERGASHLSIEAERGLGGEEPSVRLELALEWITECAAPNDVGLTDANLALDLEAAQNLIACQGGDVTITHLPGRSVRAVVHWPAVCIAEDVPEEPAAPCTAAAVDVDEPAVHRYRGALVLEADPSVRAMLARELKASGRAVFACADGAAARSFLEATPDRFELLIVDHPQRLEGGDALGKTIQELAPALRICMLSQGAGESWPGAHCIQKPFGVHELRRALASVLTG